ncbi:MULTISPECIES: acyl-CoA synthetase [Microbacterium]|uniref:Acyl-CoA synthetase n=1 Tax=Microbacterium aurugineum TaxID=2851642 RepID=A0ABY4IUD7_9MICO|nr:MULTISPECIES: acyl-CoA synthetase [Microbacterium]PKQ35993.1 MAG: acyl-CoA synthetase [Actinobacteria bacterium HGW-Actinobacteria-11]MCE0510712.1 acyl-CoA synthetase [Microbacterium sp. KKR3/1]MCK8475611.1 acyl-CoA synthetase [Microbacterium aurugineum]QEA27786.1 acyl-CoA synthetase [Microbacterium sp. CBA3102]TFB16366.1 acyl-CoA synthetase [Microbacterium sp. 3H14]
MSAPARAFTMRHVQLLRALFAAVAALMITFSSDHSAPVGLSVFSGFVFVTALIQLLAAWLVLPAGSRWPYILLGVLGTLAGAVSGIPAWRSDDLFFIVVSTWAILSGGIELLAGIRSRRNADPLSRDAITVGALGVLLGIVLLLIPAGFVQEYTIEKAGTFVLSGIILGVGMFGGYAAILAVFLGIAGLTPKRVDTVTAVSESNDDTAAAEHGGTR